MTTIADAARSAKSSLLVAATLALHPSMALADLVFEHGGHTYKLVETPATWDDAKAAAEAMTLAGEPGYLARIDSADENDLILATMSARLSPAQLANTIPDDGSEASFVWLGGSDEQREGRWVWTNNGDPFWQGDFNGQAIGGRYTNWGIQPDNAGGNENALAMGLAAWPEPFYDLGATGQWNDLEASNELVYLVEFDTVVEPLRASLDEPFNGGVHAGVGMIRGWALSEEGVDRIEVYVDGRYAFDVPYGDPRADVGEAYPDIDESSTSGFSVPFRYGALEAGEHTVSVVVTDRFGDQEERSANFEVVRFEQPFISKADTPNMDWSVASSFADYISLRGVRVGDKAYSVVMQWQTKTQSFEIVSISEE